MKMKMLLPILALASGAALSVHAADPAPPAPATPPKVEKKARTIVVRSGDDAGREKEKVTYLGVETGPVPEVLSEHLGLPAGFGLAVRSVAKESPASEVLQRNDLLKKLDDQVLVDPRQLSVLIRAKKPGDEIKLTVVRAGKEQVVTAKLGEREVPRMLGMQFPERAEGGMDFRFFNEEGPAIERLRELPGIAREELNDVLRIIGNERQNWVGGSPRVHVVRRSQGNGSTILNLPEGNFAYSDDAGAVEITASKGERKLTVKDAQGKVTFEGPINTDEQRQALPPEVKERLKKLDTLSIDFQADDSLQQEGAAVKPTQRTRVEIVPAPAGTNPPARVVVGRPI